MINILNKIVKNELLTRNIELSIYNFSVDHSLYKSIVPSWTNNLFVTLYLNKGKSLYLNLNKDSYVKNDNFLKRLENKELCVERIAYLNPQEVMPKNWQSLIEEDKNKEEIINRCKNEAATKRFVCPNKKCRARKSVYNEVQTRSADEPMTLFITCLVCGLNWRI